MLVSRVTPYVRSLAYRFARESGTDPHEAIQNGMVGLIECIQRFKLTKKVKLLTYATTRIVGAMKDGQRKHPKDPTFLVPDDAAEEKVARVPSPVVGADEALVQEERAIEVRAALNELSNVERHIVSRHLEDEVPTLGERGSEIGRGKSWCSRIETRALKALAEKLEVTP